MVNFNTLPNEIKWIIFQYIDTKQLSTCRLVCKAWDGPAEHAMLSTRQLCITQDNVESMYMYLHNKPELTHLIKDIHFDYRCLSAYFTAPLLRLAITPSIEKIDVNGCADSMEISFYHTVTDIVQDSGGKLKHFKSIPSQWSFAPFTNLSNQIALLLKDSLEEWTLPMNDDTTVHKMAMHLADFKCLSTLDVYCAFKDLSQVESIFRNVHTLKQITTMYSSFSSDEEEVSSAQRLNWMKQHVEISEDVIQIKVHDLTNMSVPLIEYFRFKYPKSNISVIKQ